MRDDRGKIGGQLHALGCAHGAVRALARARRDPVDANGPPRTARDFFGIAMEHIPRAAPDRAHAEQADAHRLHGTLRHYSRPSSRNICLTPRIACRVRDSFSIIAKRTCPSPNSPKPMPGDTDTLALAMSFLVNSSEPIPA